MDRKLETADWLCAGRFTAADISVGYALLLAAQLGLDADFTMQTAAYWKRLQIRPAFQAAKAAQLLQAPEGAEASAISGPTP